MENESYSEEFQIEEERAQFKEFILTNPNYFGKMVEGPFDVVEEMVGNTKYEELVCVGFNLNLEMLEATVHIKLPNGYGTNLEGPGTTEYVRFFVDYGDGWENAGVMAFNVHDIPDTTDCAGEPDKPLSYVVTQPIEPRYADCGRPVLPKVRAILSWEAEPPGDNPDWPMVWGNMIERDIQIKPYPLVTARLLEAIAASGQVVKLPSWLEAIKFEPIPQLAPLPLKLNKLAELYRGTEVEPHRFGFSDIEAAIPGSVNPQMVAEKIIMWEELGLDWVKAVDALKETSGDVTYEGLTCLGLDYNREWLVATFCIKLPYGYSGGLCDDGSLEYIAFWADWDDECDWKYLDTVTVNVHDIAEIPSRGLHYTAILKVNLEPKRRSRKKPKIARVRAVLSWNTPPSTEYADKLPKWGNRLDAHVQIKPGEPSEGPKISILGGIGVADINHSGTGMTKTNARFALTGTLADSLGRSCPFGGQVVVQGPPLGYKYRVWVRRFGATDATRLTKRIWTVDEDGAGTWRYPDADGFFTYLPDSQNIIDVLAYWDTSGDDLWEVRLEMADVAGTIVGTTPWYRIQLDHTPPAAEITIDGGACEQYTPGTTLTGRFVARDAHFGHFALDTLPDKVNGVTTPHPSTTTWAYSQTATSPGDKWMLDTKTMKPCGYVVRVRVWDRTILGSSPGHHNSNADEKGFCLLEKV